MQVNSVNSNQSFGAIKISDGAKRVLKKRITTESEIGELAKLVEQQKDNRFHVSLDITQDPRYLVGFVDDGSTYSKTFHEGFFAELFSSPIKLIRTMCKDADKQQYKFNMLSQIDKMF